MTPARPVRPQDRSGRPTGSQALSLELPLGGVQPPGLWSRRPEGQLRVGHRCPRFPGRPCGSPVGSAAWPGPLGHTHDRGLRGRGRGWCFVPEDTPHALGSQGALGPAGFSARTVGGQRPLSQRSLTAAPRPVPAGAACGAGLGPTSRPQGLRLPPPQFSLPFVFVSPSYVTPALGGALRPSGSHPIQGDLPRRWPGLLLASDAPSRPVLRSRAHGALPPSAGRVGPREAHGAGEQTASQARSLLPRPLPEAPQGCSLGPLGESPSQGAAPSTRLGERGVAECHPPAPRLGAPQAQPEGCGRGAEPSAGAPSHTRPGPRPPMGPSAPAAG